MKRLTLDQTWEQCLAMWKWISRRCEKGKVYCRNNDHVNGLKKAWLDANGFEGETLSNNCFFCEYDFCCSDDPDYEDACDSCPGLFVNAKFSCGGARYSWFALPRLFYAELKRLNKIRLAK